MIELAETAYEAALRGKLESCLDKLLAHDYTTMASAELLIKINSWLDRGVFFQDEFRKEFGELFGADKSPSTDGDLPKVLSLCDHDTVNLPEIRTELKNLVVSLTSANQPSTIDFRLLIQIHNQIANLINEETLTIAGAGTSWPALVVDCPDQLVTMRSKLKACNQLVFSLCRPQIVDVSEEEVMEVLLYLEGLDEVEQTKYLNIKNALLETLKQQSILK